MDSKDSSSEKMPCIDLLVPTQHVSRASVDVSQLLFCWCKGFLPGCEASASSCLTNSQTRPVKDWNCWRQQFAIVCTQNRHATAATAQAMPNSARTFQDEGNLYCSEEGSLSFQQWHFQSYDHTSTALKNRQIQQVAGKEGGGKQGSWPTFRVVCVALLAVFQEGLVAGLLLHSHHYLHSISAWLTQPALCWHSPYLLHHQPPDFTLIDWLSCLVLSANGFRLVGEQFRLQGHEKKCLGRSTELVLLQRQANRRSLAVCAMQLAETTS
jgi:hypothetical protein